MKWIFILAVAAILAYELLRNKTLRGSCAIGAPAVCGNCGGAAVTAQCCCGQITNDPATWPTGDAEWDICRAIAVAEGADVAGSVPDRCNNPGDLSRGDEHGQPVAGYQTNCDGENEIIFASKVAGWNALHIKIGNARNGTSPVYSPSWTWAQFAAKYAGNSAVWLKNFCAALGVAPGDVISAYGSGVQTAASCCGCCGTGIQS